MTGGGARLGSRAVAAAIAVVIGLAALPSTAGAAAAGRPATVTLVTGDRVTLVPSPHGRPNVIFAPAPGSKPSGFDVLRDGSHVHVVPHDVARLVPDVLDPELFDVTALVEMGYDDRHADRLPLIVRRASGVRALAATSPLQPLRRLDSIGATAVALDKASAADLGEELADVQAPRSAAAALGGATRIWLDRRVRADSLDGYLTQVKAPSAWATGLDGSGVTVAVLDTGVDDGHPALAGEIDAQANFTDGASAADGNGHGTHVVSLIAGTGAGSDGARQGIAPGVDLLSGKVLGDDAQGLESWVIAGMEWAAAHGADVVNLSLGSPAADIDDPVEEALERLTAQTGVLFVVAAGNRGGFGRDPFTIDSPGTAPSALTVGAVTASDALALFSSEGPTRGSYRLKPDVVAPGVNLLGARAGARDGDLYVGMSGTSQATPLVAGAAALVEQEHPEWTWRQVKAQIVATADPAALQSSWTHGSGRLDLDQATHELLTVDTASLDFGYLRHPDDAPKTRAVTLANHGAEPVTLTIADEERDDAGLPAPADAVTASPATLTVPAGGSANTTVRLDPALIDEGLWQGAMTLSANGAARLRLPFGVYDEPERYDLDVQVLDRNGKPYDPALGADDPNGDTTIPIFDGENGAFYRLHPDEHGHATARVAPGSYSIFARIVTPAGGGSRDTFTIAGTPELDVHSDTSYVIDARDAVRLDPPTVQGHPTEPQHAVGLSYDRHTDDGVGYTEFGFFDPSDVTGGRVFITPTPTVRHGKFETALRWRLVPTGTAASPDAYELLLNAPRFPEPLSPTLNGGEVSDLARVDATYRPVGPPGEYLEGTVYETAETGVGFVYRLARQLPDTTHVLMTAAPDVLWGHCLVVPANEERELCDDLHPYQRRQQDRVEFGAALHPEVFSTFRDDATLFVEAGLGDGQHRSGLAPSALETSRLTVYEDGRLLGAHDDVFGFFPLATAAGRFRVEQEWTLSDVFGRSRQARTAWTFDSDPSTTPPFLTLDYGAGVDELGRAEPRRPLRLDLRAGHVAGAVAPDRIETMRLWWSTDGGHSWLEAPTQRSGEASFSAAVPGSALASGGEVSLRALAADADGNEIDQTVLGIVPVR